MNWALLVYVTAIAIAIGITRALVNRRRQRENEDWKRYLRGKS